MEKEELKHLAKLLRAFRDDSVDEQEYILRDAVLFDVGQELGEQEEDKTMTSEFERKLKEVPDVSEYYPIKCAGSDCSNKETCLRFIAPALKNQTYGGFDKTEKPCLYYLPPIESVKYRHWQGQEQERGSADKY